MFGLREYRRSNIYLSVIPKSEFESDVDPKGNSATRYFTGLNAQGQPTWSAVETDAVPVVTDVDSSNPTIGNFSVVYSHELDPWLMSFDGGRNSRPTTGIYFAYASEVWGPWITPNRAAQLIINDCRNNGFANFIYYYVKAARPWLPHRPAFGVTFPASAGPTIGGQTLNDPHTTHGGSFAPQMIERFAETDGDTLKVFYNMSTWNPYAVVRMESDFTITRAR